MRPSNTPSQNTAPKAVNGCLYLIPTPLDFGCEEKQMVPIEQLLPTATIQIAAGLTHWITENAKSTRGFLGRINQHTPLVNPIQSMAIQVIPRDAHKQGDHLTDAFDNAARAMLKPCLSGENMGLVSEAGIPAVADPGSSVVRAAHTLGIPVIPLSGAVSLMLALAASGLNGQQFAVIGYLPKGAEQLAHIRSTEARALKTGETQMCIETPYRNDALLQTMLATLQPNTRLAIASGLTLAPIVVSQSVQAWSLQNKAGTMPRFPLPAVFLWGP